MNGWKRPIALLPPPTQATTTSGSLPSARRACAGLGDHALLLHALGEQRLAQHVVDLVGAGVTEVLALEPDPGPAAVLAEPGGVVERRGPPGIAGQQLRQPAPEGAITARGHV